MTERGCTEEDVFKQIRLSEQKMKYHFVVCIILFSHLSKFSFAFIFGSRYTTLVFMKA